MGRSEWTEVVLRVRTHFVRHGCSGPRAETSPQLVRDVALTQGGVIAMGTAVGTAVEARHLCGQ